MENLEKRIRQMELASIAQKAVNKALHGAILSTVIAEHGPEFTQIFNEQFNATLLSFIRAEFNNAKVSLTDYDDFINDTKKDFKFPNDISAN